ncbi:ImmA/IrrE family metallo-endopeptidase [Prescottella subtropica]|uniref:ImmA/IrrE family metallo-endopeptidase n=1 Tax=Prescottella subtropica TaxID=2545757 RepID=UPI0010F66DA0|nr:ImmA/IrrE family metallo-endopeptidase [Prescottella subtropica]
MSTEPTRQDASDAAREAAERILRDLPLSRPWTRERFIADLSIRNGRPIEVLTIPDEFEQIEDGDGNKITGVWIPGERIDYIFVTSHASGDYREHIICHELAHIIFRHQADEKTVEALQSAFLRRLMPNIHPDHMKNLLPKAVCKHRAVLTDPIEREAEWLATLLMNAADELKQPLW